MTQNNPTTIGIGKIIYKKGLMKHNVSLLSFCIYLYPFPQIVTHMYVHMYPCTLQQPFKSCYLFQTFPQSQTFGIFGPKGYSEMKKKTLESTFFKGHWKTILYL